MKQRIIIPASILYLDSSQNRRVKDYLKNNFLGNVSYYDIICKCKGQYFVHNIKDNKYYNGSTKSFYWRHLTLGYSSSWRSNIARTNSISWINKNNLEDFEIIFIPSDDDDKTRLLKEERYRMLLKTYDSRFGYNICKKSVGGNGTGGHRWVTDGNCDRLIGLYDKTPEGFFPGQKKVSWVRNFFIKYNWDYRLRDRNSELLVLKFKDRRDLLDCTIAPNLKAGCRYIASLIKNLDELYNIKIVFE